MAVFAGEPHDLCILFFVHHQVFLMARFFCAIKDAFQQVVSSAPWHILASTSAVVGLLHVLCCVC
jgi:hypothetical protein